MSVTADSFAKAKVNMYRISAAYEACRRPVSPHTYTPKSHKGFTTNPFVIFQVLRGDIALQTTNGAMDLEVDGD